MKTMSKKKPQFRYRLNKNGSFVSEQYGVANPDLVIRETVKKGVNWIVQSKKVVETIKKIAKATWNSENMHLTFDNPSEGLTFLKGVELSISVMEGREPNYGRENLEKLLD